MIISYKTLQNSVNKIDELLKKSPIKVQKVYSSYNYINLQARLPGETINILLGRGSNFQGIFLYDSLIPSPLRIQDVFLEYCRKTFKNSLILNVSVDLKDKIILIKGKKAKQDFTIGFYWRGNKLYFAKSSLGKKYFSWRPEEKTDRALSFNDFDSIGREDIAKNKDVVIPNLNKEIEQSTKKISKNKKIKTLKNKSLKIQKELNNCLNSSKLKETTNDIERLKSYIGKEKTNINGIKFKFKDCTNEFQVRDLIFQKMKRLKGLVDFHKKRLQDVNLKIQNLNKEEYLVENKPIRPHWSIKKSKTVENVGSSDIDAKKYKYRKSAFYIGLNSRSNDYIRKTYGKKDDMWFHFDEISGPHAILKLDSNDQLDFDFISIVASAMAYHSSQEMNEIPIIYTQVKNLKGIKGIAGAVNFKKEKRVVIHYKNNWKEIISEDE